MMLIVICCVVSVPLFYHMPTSIQRTVLSFIYIHREDIPLTALRDFVNTLFTAMSSRPLCGWIKMLADLLMSFCSTRIKACSDGRFHTAAKGQLLHDNSADIHLKNTATSMNSSYRFSEQTSNYASNVFNSLIDDAQHHPNGSSVWGPHCQFVGYNDQQTELVEETEFPDMDAEMSSVDFFDSSIIAATATQHAETDDNVIAPSQKHPGNVMSYFIFCYVNNNYSTKNLSVKYYNILMI